MLSTVEERIISVEIIDQGQKSEIEAKSFPELLETSKAKKAELIEAEQKLSPLKSYLSLAATQARKLFTIEEAVKNGAQTFVISGDNTTSREQIEKLILKKHMLPANPEALIKKCFLEFGSEGSAKVFLQKLTRECLDFHFDRLWSDL